MKLEECGVMHFSIDCDIYVGARKSFKSITQFLTEAMREDAGYELAIEHKWNKKEVIKHLSPFVKDDGYVIHRCTPHPFEDDVPDWWEFTKEPGRGKKQIWYLNIEEIKNQNTSNSIPTKRERK